MFLLIPTFDPHAAIASITRVLLERYWPGHPPVHVVSAAACSPWLAGVAGFLRTRPEELFILLLDDYALCGRAKTHLIAQASELMRRDESIGLFPLCWYPAGRRTARTDCPGVVTLTQTPILLQAAIWRRAWFLELADSIDPRASAWGFEAAATRIARRRPREICAIDLPEPAWVGGDLADGFDKTDWPLPYHNLMHRGGPNLQHEAFLRSEGFGFPPRGLGDTIARVAHATGMSQLAEAWQKVTGRDCGCQKRREELNRVVSYDRGSNPRCDTRSKPRAPS